MNLIKVVRIFHRAMIRKNRMIQKHTALQIRVKNSNKPTWLEAFYFLTKMPKKNSANGAGKTG